MRVDRAVMHSDGVNGYSFGWFSHLRFLTAFYGMVSIREPQKGYYYGDWSVGLGVWEMHCEMSFLDGSRSRAWRR